MEKAIIASFSELRFFLTVYEFAVISNLMKHFRSRNISFWVGVV